MSLKFSWQKLSLKKHLLIFSLVSSALPIGNCASPADVEVSNFKSGISVNYIGAKGSAYLEEYYYSDKLVCDRKTIYIKSDTLISFEHNDRNVARISSRNYQIIGKDGLDGISSSGDEGTIRYKVDRDLNWGPLWHDDGSGNPNVLPAYGEPFAFDSLLYSPGISVVGTTGPSPNIQLQRTTKNSYYFRGIVDSVGDEWHTITVADDDWKITSADTEWRASDGRVFNFVVNPKTPCITAHSTLGGQFYTTPAKTYFIPKINIQTTYISAGSGTVTLELADLYGRPVKYRINNGGWKQGSSPILSQTDFKNGTNLLECSSIGNEAFVKSRIVVKNPPYPSGSEDHGKLLWGTTNGWETIKNKIKQEPFKSRIAYDRVNRAGQDDWDLNGRKGRRVGNSFALANAFYAKCYGLSSRRVPTAAKTYAEYSKEMLLDNSTSIDSVGIEMGLAQITIPTRETIFRGYWDVDSVYNLAFAYDIMIDIYRGDKVAGGISAIEDLYLRDCMGLWTLEQVRLGGNYDPYMVSEVAKGGMWDTARKVGALACMFAMPSYSTHYYGSSGLNGNTNVNLFAPFPDNGITWKACLLDKTAPVTGFPNLAVTGLGVEEYMLTVDGKFTVKLDYFGYGQMGHNFAIAANLIKLHAPGVSMPRLELSIQNAVAGLATDVEGRGPSYYPSILFLNDRFPAILKTGLPTLLGLPSTDQNSFGASFDGTGVFGLCWVDASPSFLPTAPLHLRIRAAK